MNSWRRTILSALAAALAALLWSPAARGAAEPEAVQATAAASAQKQALGRAFAALYDRVGQLQVTPDLRVGKFLSSSPQIQALSWDAIRRAARIGSPLSYSDGIVTVQVQLPIKDAMAVLAEVCQNFYTGPDFKPADFQKITFYTDREGLWGLGEAQAEVPVSALASAPVGWEDISVFGRLEARHQALGSAYLQMAQKIQQLRLSASRRVGDFLAADPRIAADMDLFVRSRPLAGEVRYLPERLCEADVVVKLSELIGQLKSAANAYYAGTEFVPTVFDALTLYEGQPQLTVTGVAAPAVATGPAAEAPAEAVWTRVAQAEVPPEVDDAAQAQLLAVKSALAKARSLFRESIMAQAAPVGGTVGQWVLKNGPLGRDIDTGLSNLRQIRFRDLKNGRVEVTAELPIARLQALVTHHTPAK